MNKLNNIVRGTGSLIGTVSNPVVRGSSTIITKATAYIVPRTCLLYTSPSPRD